MKRFGLLPRIILAIIIGVLIGKVAPDWAVRVLATFNGLFGNFLGFIIPLIIIGFIAPGIAQLGKGAGKLLGITAGFAYLSTVTAGLLAFFATSIVFPSILQVDGFLASFENPEEGLLSSFFTVDMPAIMGVMSALLLAFLLGLGVTFVKGDALTNVLVEFRGIIEKVITAVIIPLLPIHILGIFANMSKAGQVETIMSVFAKVFILVIILHLVMLSLQYTGSGILNKKNPFGMIKGMLPAYFTALGTQSSASTIPVTLRQTKKIGVRERIADFTVPLLATIHLSGSTITLVSCSMAIMFLMGETPTIGSVLPFILMLGITMVAAPGVPGGAVMAALGLLETMLGFDQTMITLMIALYLAQDSFGTACNVTGDGAISASVDRLSKAS
ncbi:dicarboxylate/amino acid:cation symporter [Alkalihalobacillus sp. MEB130]|uniref:dicarboxylate/amino acid:cation symporter n=1 Tax=Alkalihalobacillus sp. MEB130 TaxID=2976704 RepID=UPI0028DDC89C|nr:dicarboxylate/amino acid:cation symporter [Alkalihalobacillus sp. MEB130]MDT8862577.1 dicarboxylate/amino acid:cation symporter [Alkalihalobacillus sp. MEB130]